MKKQWYQLWWVWVLIVLGVGLVFGNINTTDEYKEKTVIEETKKEEIKEQATNQATKYADIGEDITLIESCVIGITKKDYDEVIKLQLAKDNLGLSQMILNGKAILVKKDTQIKIIDSSIGLRRIRLMSGDFIGSDGWIAMEYCKSTK